MQLRTLASTLASFLCIFLIISCTYSDQRLSAEPLLAHIYVEEIQIDGDHLADLAGRQLTLQARIKKTDYDTWALYPMTKKQGEGDSGRCIDLVFANKTINSTVLDEEIEYTITGYFVLVGMLPDYVTSLDIGGIRHQPICQVFSNISPYPYFVVQSVQ